MEDAYIHHGTSSGASTRALRRQTLPPDLRSLDRAEARLYFIEAWQLYERLFEAVVRDEAYFTRPDPLRQPLIFYLGHTAAFYVNKLRMVGHLETGLDERLDVLLARGVDPTSAAELDVEVEWPSLERVRAYRGQVYDLALDAIDRFRWDAPIRETDPEWAMLMAIEHDRIHFETSSMLLRQCPLADVRRPLGWRYAPVADLREGAQESAARAGAEAPMKASSDSSPREPWVTVPAGETSVGKSRDSRTFGWDNEYGSELRHVPAFEASAYLVSNAAFQVFVQEGGYARESLWSEKGWAWVQSERVRHPRFWCPQAGGGFAYRAMFDELPMPAAWPVEVNAFEAAAYCRFRGDVRLPTEAEWCRMLDVTPRARADEEGATFHLHFSAGSPRAVDVAPSEAGRRIHDVRGNVWQWLQDEFHPLPGFRTHPLYEDFSEPYFDPDHVMLRGGSWATTGAGATVFYRLWFRRRFYQHAGFRLVRR